MRRKLLSLQPETARYMQIARPTQADIVALDQNIQAIKFGSGITLSSVTQNVSNVLNYYFLTNPSVDMRQFTGFYATITDGASKAKKVLLGAAGTGETLGANLITGWTNVGFDTFTSSGADISSAIGLSTAASCYIQISDPTGKLFKYTGDLTLKSGGPIGLRFSPNPGGGTPFLSFIDTIASASYSVYRISGTTAEYFRFTTASAVDMVALNNALSQVLTPSALGTWYTPVSEDSGWNPNSASFTVTITRS